MKFSCEVFAENLTVMHFGFWIIRSSPPSSCCIPFLPTRLYYKDKSCAQGFLLCARQSELLYNHCEGTAETESIDKVVLVGTHWWGGEGRIVDNWGHIAVIALITHTPPSSVCTLYKFQMQCTPFLLSLRGQRVDKYIVQSSIKMYQSGEKTGAARVL